MERFGQRIAEDRAQRVRGTVHLGAEDGPGAVGPGAHLRVLGAAAGQQEHRLMRVAGRHGRSARRLPQLPGRVLGGAAGRRPAVGEHPAAGVEGVRDIPERLFRMGIEVVGQLHAGGVELGRSSGGYAQQLMIAGHGVLPRVGGLGAGRFLDAQMRVGAAHAEGAHSRP
ncbi:hypothetical protein M1201_13960 [Streptomyces kronopolitis]|nr:hypothetical protein [Streptomyces kronopolitis]MCL6299484.1 hypothetical protein [Streptomyces kronopolitis]